MDLILQPSIETDLRAQAHLTLINRLRSLDLSPILVYRIASLVDSAVLAMAWQWDVLNPLLLPDTSQLVTLSWPGWDPIENIDTLINIDLLQYQQTADSTSIPLAILYAQYRALILLSTSLHSTLGTKAALQKGLAGVGYPNAVIQEGQNSWGGSSWPSNEGWAVFRVVIPLAGVPPDTDYDHLNDRMTAICNYWKPARCWLDSIQFQWYPQDTVTPVPFDFVESIFIQYDVVTPAPSDFIVGLFWPVRDLKTITPLHDTRYYHCSVTYGENEPAIADGPLVVNGGEVNVDT
jgi:hypothetical protein